MRISLLFAFVGATVAMCFATNRGAHAAPPDAAADAHLLYVALPDAAQPGGQDAGVLVFDIDHAHRFVRQIPVPGFQEGIRGLCACAPTHRAYYTTTNQLLGRLDLESDKVLWEKRYEAGCDRAAVTPDGKKLYVPTGWWLNGEKSGWMVIDAANGDLLKQIPVGSQAHNTVMSLDGSLVFGGTETMLTVFRTNDDTIVRSISPIGESGVFPFTVDSANKLAFVCLGKHVGFDIADLATGKVLHRVLAGDGSLNRRTHGAALTPDEKELWISDQGGNRLYIFDATKMPPVETAQVALSAGGHGWITFSLDGRYAWCHTPDVIDARSRKVVATLKDGAGRPVSSSKFFETIWQAGALAKVGDQFGVGRAGGREEARSKK
jgi:DNA-binding beta-propeller fold protein YncE